MDSLTISLDVESDGVNPFLDDLVLVGYKVNDGEVRQIWSGVDKELQDLVGNPGNTLLGHNVKFDALFLAVNGYEVLASLDDTKLLAYLAYPDEPNDLKYLVRTKLGKDVKTYDDLLIRASVVLALKKKCKIATSSVPRELLSEYNKEDVNNCYSLRRVLPENDWYRRVERPLLNMLFQSELRGIRIDKDELKRITEECEKEVGQLRKILREEHNLDNPNSPKQVAEILKQRGHRLEKTDKGNSRTDKITLKHFAWGGDDLARTLLRYREISKLQSTYCLPLGQFTTNKLDDKLHGFFNQCGVETNISSSGGTKTGRLSSSNPNLQNIPSRTGLGRRLRSLFIPSEGRLMFVKDLKQIEPRLVAQYSQSPRLLEAFRKGLDTHGMFASDIFGKPVDKLSKVERFIGKTSWLATVYGCGYRKLLTICETYSDEPLDIDLSHYKNRFDGLSGLYKSKLYKAGIDERTWCLWQFFKMVQDNFKEFNPEIMSWRDRHITTVRKMGYLTTLGGRIIQIKGLDSRDESERFAAEREAVNYQIQGSAADAMKLILVAFKDRVQDPSKAVMLATVHDEILGEFVDDGMEESTMRIIDDIIENTVKLPNVDIKSEGGLVANWGMK